ncbi:glycosyltransferase family 39 protein [Halorussus salilacus]|uniref:STT3 domain-containing protein n=1 Tax=Halorussus salilacus TaxID=2953750 RepID=UPI00209D7964|nr:STT3 domain-containing protein [Halorussus salilacus]USZ67380.1 glycosyltransferase family 39 protein [Halorussus salilacus]
MTDVREATDDLLAEKPDLESDLRDVLAVDDREDGWTFDDVPLDSGTFGELVSRDIVVKSDGEYEVADPAAVRASLNGDPTDDEEGLSRPSVERPSLALPSLSGLLSGDVSLSERQTTAGALGGALLFVVLMRAYFVGHVLRPDGVLLSSNDPYAYRYWVEYLTSDAYGVFDFSVLSDLPGWVANGEPLMVATLWWITDFFGGADAAGVVLAWYPVVSALVVSLFVYAIAKRLTGDDRVALASVLVLAVIPAFAYRTGLGFSDHHAFDYPWLAATAYALVRLADVDREDLREPATWAFAGLLGVAVAGQVLAWEAGPLLVAAIGLYVAVRTVADVRAGRSSLAGNAPIAGGVALAAVLSHLAHTGFGWHSGVVAYSPALLLVGVVAVSLVGEAVHRAEMPAFVLGTTEVAGALGGLGIIQLFLPAYAAELNSRLDFLLFRTGIAENKSMFAGSLGPLLGPIFELGFAWLLGVPVLVYASWRAYHGNRPSWLVVTTYAWYFLVLATLQRRFVGELAPFFAILAGWGFVALAARIDVTAPPVFDSRETGRSGGTPSAERPSLRIPSKATLVTLAVLFLFVASAGAMQTTVRHEQVKIDGQKYEAAQWMGEYADQQEWEYPEDRVLSKWGRNRVYNYYVNGEARSYGFADRNYESFLSSANPEEKYDELHDDVGFIVTKDLDLVRPAPEESMHARLHFRYGSEGEGVDGVGNYRAVYASEDGSVKVFTLVPGANVTGTASAGETVTVEKTVDIEGAQFEYERSVEADSDGEFAVTVPYPGEYAVGDETVTVSESEVHEGGNVSVGA